MTGESKPAGVQTPEVFIVGCGRSGTTLVYDTLAAHEAFAWISNWTDRSGRPELAAFHGIFRKVRRGELASRRGMPRPSEGYRLLDRALDLRLDTGVLDEAAATPERAARAICVADTHRRFGQAPVFLNKNTRNARLLGMLGAIFPDALLVHVLRSPLDAISSLVEVSWWPTLPLWTHSGATPRDVAASHEEEVAIAAGLWCAETTAAREVGARYADRYMEIRYEDFLADPSGVTQGLLDRIGLAPTPAFARTMDHLTVRQRVDSHRERLTVREQQLAWERVQQVAGDFSYTRTYRP